PEGQTFSQSLERLNRLGDIFEQKMAQSRVRLLWGTANLFTNARFMAGAASNPDPDVFAYAAATIKANIDFTHRLGGENFVLWGGREGYETLLNTRMGQEFDQIARMLSMIVDYKHKIGFSGTILLEPKPQEPMKHQYDHDVATVYGFLKKYGLENEIKVNIEVGHAILAGHSFEHEVATAITHGIFGSIDMNRNDYQSGWDTDQFPNNVPEVALAYYHILKAGGLGTGGTNFDAKLRRQSIDPHDLLHGHIGAMDTCARALKAAAAIIEDGTYDAIIEHRYADWDRPEAQAILNGQRSLAEVAARVEADQIDPAPRSGQQEYLENLINRFL
ncbi:MAG: xylose isomerase, partial [Paracoccaceae bacterium]